MDDFDPTKDSSPLLRRLSAASFASLILLALVFAYTTTDGFADEDEEESLSEEVLKAVAEFTDKAAESRIKADNRLIKNSAKALAEELELDDEVTKKLAEHFPSILEGTQRDWKEKFRKTFKAMLQSHPTPLESIKEWKPKSFARNDNYASASPTKTTEWIAALKDSLGEEQFTAYQTAREEKAEKLKIELQDYFSRCEDMVSQQMQVLMDSETELLKQLVVLDEKRSAELTAASKRAIEEILDEWIVGWKEKVYEMTDDQRKRVTGQGSYPSFDITGDENPKKTKAWKDGLAEVFTAEELKHTGKRRRDIRDARSEALAMVVIDSLQPYIGFTVEQRTKFTKLFAKPLLKLPDYYFVQQGNGGYYSLDPGDMFSKVKENAEDKVLPLLDEGQKARWEKVDQQSLNSNHYYSSGGTVDGLTVPPAKEIDETEAQRLITAYMYLKAKESIDNQLVKMEAKVDGVARIGKLDDKKMAILRTAGKGAAQELAKTEIANMEARARQQFLNVTPEDLPARLNQNRSSYYSNRGEISDPQIWVKTIARVLSEEQKKAWEAESEAAENWNKLTQQEIMMTEVDKNIPLEAEKRDALEKLVSKVMDDYHPELKQMLSANWHIQGYYGLVPLAVLTDDELGKVFSKEQISIVRSRDQGNFDGRLKSMKQMRKQRLKQERKKK